MDNQSRSAPNNASALATAPPASSPPAGGGRGGGRGGRNGGRGRGGRGRGYGGQYDDEIRTLFVSGIPNDVNEREVHNLFRFFAGYEGCILNENASKQMVTFVSFQSRELALRALRYLQDVRFDLNSQTVLRISFAKSNSKTKRLDPQDLFPADHNRLTTSLIPPPPSHPFMGSLGASSLVNAPPYYSPYAQYGASGYAVPWLRQNVGGRQGNRRGMSRSLSEQSLRAPPSTVPPCSTLFVGNIHPEVPERDLIRIFKIVPGFQRLKMSSKNGLPICFVEYNDVQNSTVALQSFQAMLVGPSPIRIDYARNRMAEKRPAQPKDEQHDDGHASGTFGDNAQQHEGGGGGAGAGTGAAGGGGGGGGGDDENEYQENYQHQPTTATATNTSNNG